MKNLLWSLFAVSAFAGTALAQPVSYTYTETSHTTKSYVVYQTQKAQRATPAPAMPAPSAAAAHAPQMPMPAQAAPQVATQGLSSLQAALAKAYKEPVPRVCQYTAKQVKTSNLLHKEKHCW